MSARTSFAKRFLPGLTGLGAFGLLFAVVLVWVVSDTAPKEGNCFAPGSLGDHWIIGIAKFGGFAGLATVAVGLAGVAFSPGRRLFCLAMTLVAAGAALFCLLAGLGNAICEY